MTSERINISTQNTNQEPIAIIGIGCRFPGGADNPEQFWKLLADEVDAISDVPPNRYNIDAFYDPDTARPMKATTRWGGFVNQRVEEFDAQFFGMSPREAACLDPLQRWLLEVSWEALEDGGQLPEQLAGTDVGVYIGGFTLDNTIMQFNENNRQSFEAHTATGTALTILSARLSYYFDFKGPCLSLDTACSSSLVAVHLACQSIWNGESSLALAGGANAMFTPEHTVAESMAGMLSPDGRCKAFDSKANGYVRGEGAGIVLLKPLAQAQSDGDSIYAVIRGSACNQDGFSNGITVPNGESQEAAVREACRKAGIAPRQIQYVEAHGTGTPVGDPIEVGALANVLGDDRRPDEKCLIGSVKTNIGHTEAVAGVAGLIKAALALKQKKIPAHLHFNTPNPKIRFDENCLDVPTRMTPWPECDGPAIAGVNSFGFGGTNAHVILQEAPKSEDIVRSEEPSNTNYTLPLSAKSTAGLHSLVDKYHSLLKSDNAPNLQDVCYSASLRRAHLSVRQLFFGRSKEELLEQLDEYLTTENDSPSAVLRSGSKAPRLAYVFSGMGPQWWGMGQELLEREPVFRQAIEEIDALFRDYAGWSLLEAMQADEATSRMEETEVAQPANFALQVGLAALFRSWGIKPVGIVGHSAGEVAAAYEAGMLSLEAAIRVIYHRSRLQQLTTGQGKLVAVGLSLEKAEAAIANYRDSISIAAINSPSAVTLVGDPASLESVTTPLLEDGVFCRFLNVKVPYHSHYMNPLRAELFEVLADLDLQPATTPLYSTVTGEITSGPEMDAEYWWRNVREPVYFAKTAQALFDDDYDVFLEIGPHPVLSGSIKECLAVAECDGATISTLRRFEDEHELTHDSLGALYAQRIAIDWNAFFSDGGNFTKLPTYPWQREVHWKESEASKQFRFAKKSGPLLGSRLPLPHPAWDVEIDIRQLPFLKDHCIQDAVVFPGAGFVEMAWEAAQEIYPGGATSMEIEFRKALFLRKGETSNLHIAIDPKDASFEISSRPRSSTQPWILHASGRLGQDQKIIAPDAKERFQEAKEQCVLEIQREACYRQFRKMGLEYGETFQGIDRLWQGDNEALAQIKIHDQIESEADDYRIHPAVLDVCFQVLAAALPFADDNESEKSAVYMPTGVEQGKVYGRPRSKMWIHANITEKNDQFMKGDIRLCDEAGDLLVEIKGCRAVTLEEHGSGGLRRQPQDFFEVMWVPEESAEAENTIPAQDVPDQWVIFSDRQGTGKALSEKLEARGKSCIHVHIGDVFEKTGKSAYCLNPNNPENFQQLMSELNRTNTSGWGLVHLWSLDITATDHLESASLEQAEELGSLSMMHLVQAIVATNPGDNTRLWTVTKGAQFLTEDAPDKMAVGQTSVWGLGRVIGHQENGKIWGGLIDLDPESSEQEVSLLTDKILQPSENDEFAFRKSGIFVPRVVSCKNMAAALPHNFRPDGTYLITGGLGSLGLLVANWMVERGARHLALLGRTELPDRCEWNTIGKENRHFAAISAIRNLEAKGAICYSIAADVADEKQLLSFLEDFRQSGKPPFRGLIHSAGTARPKLLVNMDAEEFKAVLRPKMSASWHLHRHLAKEPLDFFILFSSVASVVVSPGQSNYAAGNAFLDGLAQYRRAKGLPGMSINWGPWGEVGMATQFEDLNDYFDRRGMFPMTSEHGMSAFATAFGQEMPQVMIISANWSTVKDMNYPPGQAPELITEVVAESEQEGTEDSASKEDNDEDFLNEVLLVAEDSVRNQLLAEFIQNIVARVLRLSKTQRDQLTSDQPLNSYGLDSMMAIEMKTILDRRLEVELAVMDLLNGLTAQQLAEKLLDQIAETADSASKLLKSA